MVEIVNAGRFSWRWLSPCGLRSLAPPLLLCSAALSVCLSIAGTRDVCGAEPAADSKAKKTESPKENPAVPDKNGPEKTETGKNETGKKPAKATKPKRPDTPIPENPFPKRFPAASLEGGTEWLNVSGPITLKDLRGKVVLLDFWTYCCINCMHVLPDLKYLEKKFDKELVVIGVHSAKFDNEKASENIRRAVMRYEIEHPVINDSEMTVWRKFGIRSWPSLVLIDPEGNYCGYISGEGNREVLEEVIGKLIAYHRAKKTLDESPVKFNLEREKAQPTPLRFPGKVLADEAGDRLFISDSNHNRIVITTLAGKLREVIGSGAIGRTDGSYDKASFDHPQGMALVGEMLYVADTENHMIRTIDLAQKAVGTLAGTGEQSTPRSKGGAAAKAALNSPWDLLHLDGKLYIAMAGPHQLWMLNLGAKTVKPFAGSGREDIVNGPLDEAALAQPSGITTDGKALYVVDSEGSSVRRVTLGGGAEVTTIVGTSDLPGGRCLFEFGDKDGVGDDARLQHPLGIAFHAGQLYVADSYNHKIKRVDPVKKESQTFLGDGTAGDRDAPPRFSEPAGLTFAGDTMYVADTNNHLIRLVDLKTSKVSMLTIEGLTPPSPPAATADLTAREPVSVEPQRLAAGNSLAFEITVHLPEGYKLNKLAPLTYRVNAASAQTLVDPKLLGERQKIEPPPAGEPVKFSVPLAVQPGKAELRLTLSYSYCRDGVGGLCKFNTVTWAIPVELASDATLKSIKLEAGEKPVVEK